LKAPSRKKRNRLAYHEDNLPPFILMHVIFFLVQIFFFWIYFAPTPFTEWNIPVIYFRIQQIGYPTVLICSLIWMNRAFFPGEAWYLLISIGTFVLEWFHFDAPIIRALTSKL
jgi:hypothetical protein